MTVNNKKIASVLERAKNLLTSEEFEHLNGMFESYQKLDKLIISTSKSKDKSVATMNIRAKLALKSTRTRLLALIRKLN